MPVFSNSCFSSIKVLVNQREAIVLYIDLAEAGSFPPTLISLPTRLLCEGYVDPRVQ
ncbi:hypothetical protein RRG08_061178, partial [Elysia crispata]